MNLKNTQLSVRHISQEEEILLGDFDYPIIDVASIHFPIVFRHTRWKSIVIFFIAFILAWVFAILLLFILRNSIITHYFSGFFWIGSVSFGLMFLFSAATAWQHYIRYCIPEYLTIDRQKITYQTNSFKPELTIIPFDRLFWASTILISQKYTEYANFIHYITLSEDKEFYQKHKANLLVPFIKDKQKSLELTAIIRTLMQNYHQQNKIIEKLPKVKVIKQR